MIGKMSFNVSLAQINPKGGDIAGNSEKILAGIAQAKKDQCDLVVFPEMALSGYCLDEKLFINLQFLRENKRVLMERILPATQEIAVIVGFVDFDEQRKGPEGEVIRFNAAAVLQQGELLQIVHKRLLPSYRYFDDKRYFTPGREVQPISIQTTQGEVSLGVLICEDLWEEGYDFKPCTLYREQGVDYLITINASPFVGSTPGQRDGKRFERADLLESQAQRFGVPVLYLNTVGVADNGKNVILFDGMSLAYDRTGQRVAVLKQFREDQQTVSFAKGTAVPVPEPAFDREAEIYQGLVMGVRDYYEKTGIFKSVLQTLSGGIDSALGTAIAFEAMGRELLEVYNLPSQYNSEQGQDLARQLAENFKLKYHVIPIQEMVDQFTRDFEHHLHPIQSSVTRENLQARVRGLIMMAESNDREALLLTNGNETEIALGYTTLYGDMAGGLSVIGDLSKPDVYRLAQYVNRKWGQAMIPEEIFETPPSAELRENQVDPFDYQVVSPLVSDFMERGLSPTDLVDCFQERRLDRRHYSLEGKSIYERYSLEEFRELAQELFRKLNRSVYKRLQGAPIIVVSRRAFGFDLRETIINGWEGSVSS
ncbi:MAG: NAD(+) synthase [Acidobacteria bacterium]|nr:MAG: NAD(+) synthase [Acidobacteriota bacterium]